MTRQTSLEAYLEITKNGTRETLKQKVWKYIIDNGPCTQDDAFSELCGSGYSTGSYTTRFAELKKEGAIKEVGKKFNLKTKKNNYLWDVTGRAPIKFDKPIKYKCKHCNGTGETTETQARLF